MKRLFVSFSTIAIANVAIAPAAFAGELSTQTKLNERFEQERIETLNELTDRFEDAREQNLDS